MLPDVTGICCYAFIYIKKKKIIASVHSFFYILFFFKSGIDKSTELSTIPACPSLMCFFFFNRGDTEGTNSSKNLFYVNLCQD